MVKHGGLCARQRAATQDGGTDRANSLVIGDSHVLRGICGLPRGFLVPVYFSRQTRVLAAFCANRMCNSKNSCNRISAEISPKNRAGFSGRVLALWLAGKCLKTKEAVRLDLSGLGTVASVLG